MTEQEYIQVTNKANLMTILDVFKNITPSYSDISQTEYNTVRELIAGMLVQAFSVMEIEG